MHLGGKGIDSKEAKKRHAKIKLTFLLQILRMWLTSECLLLSLPMTMPPRRPRRRHHHHCAFRTPRTMHWQAIYWVPVSTSLLHDPAEMGEREKKKKKEEEKEMKGRSLVFLYKKENTWGRLKKDEASSYGCKSAQ